MSDDDPERLRPGGPALNSFELLTQSPPSPGDPFGGMSLELQERIRRKREERRAWENDPDNKEEDEFWWDVGDRGFELKMREDELKDVPATDAQAVAARNQEQRRIKAERIALKEDEREVRSAAPTEMLTTIERVRRRWDERDKIAGGLIAPEQGQDLAEHSQAPTSTNPRMTGAPGRPTKSMDLIKAEQVRRQNNAESQPKLKKEATALEAWLKGAHPSAAAPTLKTIENGIRDTHRSYLAKSPEIIDGP
jgi:hypothetical protein